jgi:hypothetical protein
MKVKADGAAGARRASALLGIAACAETTHATLDEDAAKVDIKFSFRHTYEPGKLITFHAQVKSGESFRASSSNRTTLTLQIDKETLQALSGPGVPGLIVWVPPKPMDRLYWYANDPRRPLKRPVKVGRHQYVRPSIRYDLSRLTVYASWTKSSAMQTVGVSDKASVSIRAKKSYAEIKSQAWWHPLVGKLAITRSAWRHVTRQSRATQQRILRLRVVPYLKEFLGKAPDRFVCDQGPIDVNGRRTIDTRYVLCWYRGALRIENEPYSLLLRIKEEISYPTHWQTHPLGTSDVRQEATLASWWCKKER